ncbi:microrchidia 7-like protein [Tanacetum coccineum]
MDEEHEAVVEIFSDERSRQCEMESNLRNKWQVRGGTDSEMINSLLQDLLSERDKNALLEKQLQNAEEKIQEAEQKIKKLDEEHEAIIEIFSDERSRQYEMESNLRKKWQDAMNTFEELHKQIKELENSIQMSADVTTDFVKDAKDHIDAEGFNVYHKNWLIKPFWRIWNAAGSDGRGKCGPSEILKHPRPVEYAQYDVTPEAYVSTSRKSPFKASTSSKVLKESTNSIPFKVNQNNAQTLNANGYASVGHIGDIVEELRKQNHRLKQRGGSTDSEMINSVSAV